MVQGSHFRRMAKEKECDMPNHQFGTISEGLAHQSRDRALGGHCGETIDARTFLLTITKPSHKAIRELPQKAVTRHVTLIIGHLGSRRGPNIFVGPQE